MNQRRRRCVPCPEKDSWLLIFNINTCLSVLSRGTTLLAGDIIATGTPEGVRFARKPPEFLKPRDVVESEIDGIGTLRNTMEDVSGQK